MERKEEEKERKGKGSLGKSRGGRKSHIYPSSRSLSRSKGDINKKQQTSKNVVEEEMLKLHQGSCSANEEAASASVCHQTKSLTEEELRRILESSDEEEFRLDTEHPTEELQAPVEVPEEEPSGSMQREAASHQELSSIHKDSSDEHFHFDRIIPGIKSQPTMEKSEAGPSTSAQAEVSIEDFQDTSYNDNEFAVVSNVNASHLEPVGIPGRRIVDVGYFFKEMHKKFDNHSRGIECRFKDIGLVGSRCHGLKTQVHMQCHKCNYKASIWTEPENDSIMDINHSAVAGALAAGIEYSQTQELLARMNIPRMSKGTYKKCNWNISVAFKKAAENEMNAAAAEEKRLAAERGDFIKGIPHIPVVADESWMKRFYRLGKDNFPSSVGAIVGYHTKKILFIGVRNKYCSICESAARSEEEPIEHGCFKNWGQDQTSASMEADAIVAGFQCSVEMHGLIYSTLIGDGNDRVYNSIQTRHPYMEYNYHIKKVECPNYLFRMLTKDLKNISQTKDLPLGALRNTIANSGIGIGNAVVKAAEYRAKEKIPTNEKVVKLQKDMCNIPSHIFGEHKNCANLRHLCDGSLKEGEINLVPDLQRYGLYWKIQNIVSSMARSADSLIYNLNSSSVESYNAVICKFISGKLSNESPEMMKQFEENRRRKVEKTAGLKLSPKTAKRREKMKPK